MSTIAIIAALDKNNLIGSSGNLPWPKIKADMRYFRATTLNHPIVMGRKTFDSLGQKPLPFRNNIILTRDKNYTQAGCEIIHEVGAILHRPDQKIFIIGGASVYREFLPFTTELYLTQIDASFVGDTYFPKINWAEWRLREEKRVPADTENPYPLRFTIWELATRTTQTTSPARRRT